MCSGRGDNSELTGSQPRQTNWLTDAPVLLSSLREAALLIALGHGVRERALMELLEKALQRDSVPRPCIIVKHGVCGGRVGIGVILILRDLQGLYCSASLLLLCVS